MRKFSAPKGPDTSLHECLFHVIIEDIVKSFSLWEKYKFKACTLIILKNLFSLNLVIEARPAEIVQTIYS